MTSAVIVRNPRRTGGPQRHAESWRAILEAAGFDVEEVHPRLRPRARALVRAVPALVRGDLVPEALLLDVTDLEERVSALQPSLVILQTARVYRPELADLGDRLILDFVDRLSRSYAQRATSSTPLRSLPYRFLAATHRRFERRSSHLPIDRVAAGSSCASGLGAVWIPIVVDQIERAPVAPELRPHDAVFFGSLNYPPNVEALRWLATADTSRLSVLVAGRSATTEVRSICEQNQWTLTEDFPSTSWLADQARIAIAPLVSTAGIQIKVLESAAGGLPIVATPQALHGLDADFPSVVADDPTSFVRAVRHLLDDPATAADLGRRGRQHVAEVYNARLWSEQLLSLTAAPVS